jgi:hypothetical protein
MLPITGGPVVQVMGLCRCADGRNEAWSDNVKSAYAPTYAWVHKAGVGTVPIKCLSALLHAVITNIGLFLTFLKAHITDPVKCVAQGPT